MYSIRFRYLLKGLNVCGVYIPHNIVLIPAHYRIKNIVEADKNAFQLRTNSEVPVARRLAVNFCDAELPPPPQSKSPSQT